jgi:hypothetical protein
VIELGPAVEDDDTDVPFSISRAYNPAPHTGTRLSLGVPVCSPFSLAVEPEGTHAAYGERKNSVAFMALKPITPYGKPLS